MARGRNMQDLSDGGRYLEYDRMGADYWPGECFIKKKASMNPIGPRMPPLA